MKPQFIFVNGAPRGEVYRKHGRFHWLHYRTRLDGSTSVGAKERMNASHNSLDGVRAYVANICRVDESAVTFAPGADGA